MVLAIILDSFSSRDGSDPIIAHLAFVSSGPDGGEGYFADSSIITAIDITNHAGVGKHWLQPGRRVNAIGIYKLSDMEYSISIGVGFYSAIDLNYWNLLNSYVWTRIEIRSSPLDWNMVSDFDLSLNVKFLTLYIFL